MPGAAVQSIPVKDIRPNPFQPRRVFQEEAIDELALSLNEHGMIQPVVVSRRQDGYHLIVGERRWRAAKKAGLKTIPALVQNCSRSELVELALVENLQREELNPVEEAYAYQFLLKEHGLTQEEVADKVSRSRPTVANTLRLLSLPADIQESLEKGEISAGHARALLALGDNNSRTVLWKKILRQSLSVRQVENIVKRRSSGRVSRETRKGRVSPDIRAVEEELQRILGARVSIRQAGQGKGRLEISYASLSDLERIVEMLLKAGSARRPGALSVDLL